MEAHLAQLYLFKGISATTAIEGNTLTEAEVAEILADRKTLHPSQGYLQREVENMERVLRQIDIDAQTSDGWRVTPDWLKAQNCEILNGIEDEDHVVPGEYTTESLLLGNVYRAAPPEDGLIWSTDCASGSMRCSSTSLTTHVMLISGSSKRSTLRSSGTFISPGFIHSVTETAGRPGL